MRTQTSFPRTTHEVGFAEPRGHSHSSRATFEFGEDTVGRAFEVGPASGSGEQYVNTSTWRLDPLRIHPGSGANLMLRWNSVPADVRAIDVVVHLHGYIGLPPNEQMLRAVVARAGLDLT